MRAKKKIANNCNHCEKPVNNSEVIVTIHKGTKRFYHPGCCEFRRLNKEFITITDYVEVVKQKK